MPIPGQACRNLGLSNNCIVSTDVKRLKAADILDETGADFAAGNDLILVGSATDLLIRTVTLTAPRAGIVIANASGYFLFLADFQGVRCSISENLVLDFDAVVIAENGDLISNLPWTSVRSFEVPAGDFTVNVICDQLFGSTQTFAGDTQLVAYYVPTRY